MKLSEEVRQLCIPEPGQWWLVKDKLADRIAALEAELAAAPQKERERLAKLADKYGYLHQHEILAGKLS